jgi:CRISPR-associated endoribonuclease Cas6
MTTLYSSIIHLTNLYKITIPRPGGQHAHAAFLDIVRAVDPSLSERLHNTNGRKPFTVSPLMGMPNTLNREARTPAFARSLTSRKVRVGDAWTDHQERNAVDFARPALKNEIHLREGWECWLRVTILDDRLFKTFIDYFMSLSSPTRDKGRLPQIRLGDAHFCVSEILTTPGSHPWAGYITLEDLQKRLDESPPSSITFELHSPTSFNLGKDYVETIPYPKLVFGNLATAWKAMTGENMVEAVEKYAERNWRPILHRLERKALTLHNKPQLGSVGKVEYQRLDEGDVPLARALNLLADLAFYTGLGRKTAQGMGMASRIVG